MKTTIFAAVLIFICLGCTNKPKQVRINVNYNNGSLFTIPVKIGDTIIQMLWDTGCAQTLLSKKLADNLSIRPTKTKMSNLTLFKHKIDSMANNNFEFINTPVFYSDSVTLEIGDLQIESDFIILDNLVDDKDLAVLGNNIMYRYYYAMHITDKYMTFSDSPMSFDKNQIVDSLVFRYENDHLMISKIKVNQDSLRLVFDSGMLISTQYKKNAPIYFELLLLCKDSTSIAANVYNKIKDKHKVDLTIFSSDNTMNKATYGENIAINSSMINAYVQLADAKHDKYDGLLNLAFIARFDIMYCNPFDRVIKLYKLKDRESLMKVIPFYEFVQGISGVEYTADGDTIKHKDVGSLARKRFK